jgi:hypothetical protein
MPSSASRRLFLTYFAAFLLPASITSLAAAPAATSPAPAASFLAGCLVNDARDTLRDLTLPPAAAAAQATVLLQFADQLAPGDLRTLHLLAQTAQAAAKTSVRRAALRQIIAADPGDLVAQVQYIDLLADDSQKAEDRIAFYKRMLAQTDLDAQVRSEVALRLARLAEARGDAAACRDFLGQAVKLNDVNVGALRDLVRLAAAEDAGSEAASDHLKALVNLLAANPYQPDAWLTVARIAQSAGIHDRAAEFLDTAADQYRLDGNIPAGDLYLDLAIEFALAGRPAQARDLASKLANLPDAPLAALLVDELLARQKLPASASPLALQPATRAPEIRKRLAELARDPQEAAALADAAGADLTILPIPGPDTPAWIDAYAKFVTPEDPTLIRLKGWLLYRQNKLEQAQTLFEKTADPLAQLCRARILLATGHAAMANQILQGLWNTNPSGLLALQIALTADHPDLQALHLTLVDSTQARQVRPLIARLTPALANLHRQPQEAQVVALNLRQLAVGFAEPALLQTRITNALDRAVPVGPDGLVKTTVGLAAAARAGASTPLGLYALEDIQRVFRLESHQMTETTLRADQGRLANFLEQNPATAFTVSIVPIISPRLLSPTEFTAGLGGQALSPGEFQRVGLPLATPTDYQRLTQDLTPPTPDRLLPRVTAAAVCLGKQDAPAAQLAAALAPLCESKDPLVRAALLRALPDAPAGLEKAIAPLESDADPLVRLLWARNQARRGNLNLLERLSASEKNPLVADWLASELPLLRSTTTKTQ